MPNHLYRLHTAIPHLANEIRTPYFVFFVVALNYITMIHTILDIAMQVTPILLVERIYTRVPQTGWVGGGWG